ncbi:protein spinster protein [Ancylostoma caninum]|uniref:Protein spinster protein n=1 Tax=Ancylostoma caninum TaxID=29170 RepID=A0A368GUA3_ANCCA|nr:protein spinster protein [Ancylostoma caninum]
MVNERKDYISVTILFIVNLLNFVDRYTVAGILTQVQDYYNIDDSMAGLIQTVFLAFFMIGSPLCGYLGDRFNRKLIIIAGVITWLAAVVASSFVPAHLFWLFLVFRGLVGIGEASYSNVCPSMISDMFTGAARSRMYMLFYFAVPVGSGLGFVVGSNVASLMNAWQWGIRVTAVAGIVALALLIFLVFEPERGAAEKQEGGAAQMVDAKTSYWEDIKSLAVIPTFVSCTWAYTALLFVTGTLTWWEPTIIEHSLAWNQGLNDTRLLPNKAKNQVGLIFGGITTVSGLIGVSAGTIMSGMMRQGRGICRPIRTERAQPIISGLGALIAAPLLLVIFLVGHKSIVTLWVLIFITIICLCFNWGLNVDMLMSVIVPSRRSTAFSYFMLISHLFGDATAPYIIGAVSDAIRGEVKTPETQYISLVKACSVTVVLLCISAALYFVSAGTLLRDQKKFRKQMGMTRGDLTEKTPSQEKLNKNSEEDDREQAEQKV